MKKTIRVERDVYQEIRKHARGRAVPIALVIKEYVDAELPKAERLAKATRTR